MPCWEQCKRSRASTFSGFVDSRRSWGLGEVPAPALALRGLSTSSSRLVPRLLRGGEEEWGYLVGKAEFLASVIEKGHRGTLPQTSPPF